MCTGQEMTMHGKQDNRGRRPHTKKNWSLLQKTLLHVFSTQVRETRGPVCQQNLNFQLNSNHHTFQVSLAVHDWIRSRAHFFVHDWQVTKYFLDLVKLYVMCSILYIRVRIQ